MKIGEKIRKVREINELSQEDVATKLHMSVSGYGKIERGETRIYLDKLIQIANVLEIDVNDLLAIDEDNMVYIIKDNHFSSQDKMENFGRYYGSTREFDVLQSIIKHQEQVIEQQSKFLQERETFILQQMQILSEIIEIFKNK